MNIDKYNFLLNKVSEAITSGVLVTGTLDLQLDKNNNRVPTGSLAKDISELRDNEYKASILGVISMAWESIGGSIDYTGSLTFLNWRGWTALALWLGTDNKILYELSDAPVESLIDEIKKQFNTVDNK